MEQSEHMYRASVWCGVVCFIVTSVLGWLFSPPLSEWAVQLAWVALLTATSIVCAYRQPKLGWQAGAMLMAVQWLCFFVLTLVTGELFHPSSSTGGMVGMAIGTVFMVIVSPIPILAGTVASRVRRWRDSRVQVHS